MRGIAEKFATFGEQWELLSSLQIIEMFELKMRLTYIKGEVVRILEGESV